MRKLLYKSVAMAMAASFLATSAVPAAASEKAAQVKNVRGGAEVKCGVYSFSVFR